MRVEPRCDDCGVHVKHLFARSCFKLWATGLPTLHDLNIDHTNYIYSLML